MAQEKTWRACIIGHTGRGDYGHDLDLAFRKLPRVTVAAVADPDEKGRLAAVRRTGAAKGYADYHDMIRQEKPDIVAVCPRHVTNRVEMVTAAAEAGAHAFVEKPFAASLEEADAMLAVAEKNRTKIAVAHPARLHPNILHVKKVVEEGLIGQLMEVRARGKEDHRAGAEDFMVHGPHCFYLMRFFAGEPLSCSARITSQGREITLEDRRTGTEPVGPIAGDSVRAEYAFPGGVTGFFASQRAGEPVTRRFQIALHGSKGVIVVHIGWHPPAFLLNDPVWTSGSPWQPVPGMPAGEPLKAEDCARRVVEDLIRSVETGGTSAVSGAEGRAALEMILAGYVSHFQGKRVSFPLKERKHPLG